jgi:predicted metal-dependent hydrolase
VSDGGSSEALEADGAVPAPPVLGVSVTRSRRRKRTVASEIRGDTLHVMVPAWMSESEIEVWVGKMRASAERRLSAERVDLPRRALVLARTYGLRTPVSIVWSNHMASRWGSCTPSTGAIRLSTELARFPDWVIDYVIVHELAHLHVSGHGAQFWELVHRYPRAERAIGYLMAKGGEIERPG